MSSNLTVREVKFPSKSQPKVKHTVTLIARKGIFRLRGCSCQGFHRVDHCWHIKDPKVVGQVGRAA